MAIPNGFIGIPGWEQKYFINRKAQVFNAYRGILMKTHLAKHGYLMITLSDNGKRKTYLLHRLVALTFIPNPKGYPQVNHKDENKLNNDVSNLEFCTAKYNSNYGTRTIRSSLTRIDRAISGKPVKQIDRCGNVIAIYPSAAEASRHVHGKPSNILNICRGDPHRHYVYGYTWKFANSEELQ